MKYVTTRENKKSTVWRNAFDLSVARIQKNGALRKYYRRAEALGLINSRIVPLFIQITFFVRYYGHVARNDSG